MVTDLISDFLTRIRNAQERKEETLSMPSSRMLVSLAEILKEEGFIADYSEEKAEPQNILSLTLRYVNGVPAISGLKRVSKPGVRKYFGYREIKPVRHGLGVAIFSTPVGVISGNEAVKQKVGGEYLCYIF